MIQLSDSEFDEIELKTCSECNNLDVCKTIIVHKRNRDNRFIKGKYIKFNACEKCFKTYRLCMYKLPYQHYCKPSTSWSQIPESCYECGDVVCFEHTIKGVIRLKFGVNANNSYHYCQTCAITKVNEHFTE